MSQESTLRYLKVDFQAHKDALLQRVRARWPQSWNDFLSNSFGVVLVDIVAWSSATLAFLVNRAAAELYVPTMTLRESAVRLGALVGYQLRGPVPAVVSCEATLSSVQTADVTIAKGTLIRTADENAVAFEVVKDYAILAGDLSPRTLIATLSPSLSGAKVINSFVSVTTGSVEVDLVDSTIDLSKTIEPGQTFSKRSSSSIYTIQGLEQAPGAVSANTRIVLNTPYLEATEVIEAEVFDQRIQLVQGQTVIDRFVAPASDSPNFAVKLSRDQVIDNSIVVTVNETPWALVSATSTRSADDEVYQIKTFVSGVTAVVFGDGNFGALIPPESAILVQYRIGGGTKGNILKKIINTSITGLITSLSNPVPVTITNASSEGAGGRDAETLEEARVNIPFYARTNDRAVTVDDYQTIAQQYSSAQYGSVAFARAAIRTENSFLEGNNVVIYAWTTGPGGGLVALPSPLKLALQDYMQTKAVGTDLVQIFDGTNRPVPLSLRFKVFSGFSVVDTQELVKSTIRNSINTLRPGQPLIFSDLVRSLDTVFGVDNLNIATPIADLVPSNSTELFTPTDDTFEYDLQRNGVGTPASDNTGAQVNKYQAQLPVFPLAVWSFRLFLGSNELTIMPYVAPGQARVLGENVSADDNFPSVVSLLTGQVTLWLRGAPGDLTMKLVSVQGYSIERPVNVYIGYIGDNSLTKRQEVRSALRAWSDGLPIGGAIYARRVPGILASTVSITDVVGAISGVDSVTRVALDTPANNEDRIHAADFELLRLGSISLNNQL